MKYKLIELIEQVSVKCDIENHGNISGINIQKRFMPSKNSGSNTSNYKIVGHNQFACNLMHVGRDEKIPIALNFDNQEIVVSPAYTVFRVIDTSMVNIDYLNMIFTSSEFDRYAWFCTDASIRGNLDWERFLDIEIDLPPIDIQEKYVAVYKTILDNQKAYETGLEDLKLVCDATVEKLRKQNLCKTIGNYIEKTDERNNGLGLESVRGLSIEKKIIPTKAKMDGVNLASYKLFKPEEIAYVTVTSRNGDKITIAQNNTSDTYLVSSSYITFRVKDRNVLLPEFLFMYFNRNNFDRYARYNSWGSARETYNWEDLCEFEIPIPDIAIQQSVVDIYNAYITRKEINEKLKQQIKDICPILIAGAIKEASTND